MSETSRIITPFYETGGLNSLSYGRAEDIYHSAVQHISPLAGHIALPPLQSVRIASEHYPLEAEHTDLGTSQHAALLTRGRIEVSGNDAWGATALIDYAGVRRTRVLAKVPRRPGGQAIAIATTVHELGHSLGLSYNAANDSDHCSDSDCIMYGETPNVRQARQLLAREPFCDDCAGQLAATSGVSGRHDL